MPAAYGLAAEPVRPIEPAGPAGFGGPLGRATYHFRCELDLRRGSCAVRHQAAEVVEVGLKMAQAPSTRLNGILVAVGFMAASGFLLLLAQRQIPIGTAYAVWAGIGAAGTFLVGVMIYNDPTSLARYAGVALIISGVVTLKFAH